MKTYPGAPRTTGSSGELEESRLWIFRQQRFQNNLKKKPSNRFMKEKKILLSLKFRQIREPKFIYTSPKLNVPNSVAHHRHHHD